MLGYIERHATPYEEGWKLERRQTMAIMGWNPSEIRWEMLERAGVTW